ncbi:hypothetical protein ANN_12437 [Periplaneta americana]|uniref:Uncharacterized protein n=1 Tax=Periplaneta americana TaxID=6978 RepID=A0ABQ8TH78_PERAM|nr:hypothetical protein ANN_12437 [Periplaneta americana]
MSERRKPMSERRKQMSERQKQMSETEADFRFEISSENEIKFTLITKILIIAVPYISADVRIMRLDLQFKLTDLQCDVTMKANCKDLTNVELFKSLAKNKYLKLRSFACSVEAMFATTYVCEKLFSTIKIVKIKLDHDRQTNAFVINYDWQNILLLSVEFPQNIIPKLITEWKYAKYIVFKVQRSAQRCWIRMAVTAVLITATTASRSTVSNFYTSKAALISTGKLYDVCRRTHVKALRCCRPNNDRSSCVFTGLLALTFHNCTRRFEENGSYVDFRLPPTTINAQHNVNTAVAVVCDTTNFSVDFRVRHFFRLFYAYLSCVNSR